MILRNVDFNHQVDWQNGYSESFFNGLPDCFRFFWKISKITVYIQQTPTFVFKNYFVLDIQGKLSLQNGCEPIGTNVKTIRVICTTPMTTHQNVHYAALTLSTKPNMFWFVNFDYWSMRHVVHNTCLTCVAICHQRQILLPGSHPRTGFPSCPWNQGSIEQVPEN